MMNWDDYELAFLLDSLRRSAERAQKDAEEFQALREENERARREREEKQRAPRDP